MTPARLLIGLLVLATVLVDLVVWSIATSRQSLLPVGIGPALVVAFSLAISQVSLLALWAVLGAFSVPWRLFSVTLAVSVWAHCLTRLSRPDSWVLEIASTASWLFLGGQALLILMAAMIGRLAGFAVVDSRGSGPSCADAQRPVQFTLSHLLSWLTVVALGLGLVKQTVRFQTLPAVRAIISDVGITLTAFGLANAVLAIVALWTVFGTGRIRYAALGLAVLGTIFLAARLPIFGHVRQDVLLVLLQLVWLLGSLGVVRVTGYRIVRTGPQDRPTAHARRSLDCPP